MLLKCTLLLLALLIGVATSNPAPAAQQGKRFDSYRDLHRETQYGSLFFNEGAIRYHQSRARKRFVQITGSGEIHLPAQEGYCFVFNHLDENAGKEQKYRVAITKQLIDGKVTIEKLDRLFAATTDLVSSNLPDWCISGTANALSVSLDFSSDDGAFNRTIFFTIR
jgi:hypothetical protein